MAYDRNVPYNELPLLPPPEDKVIDTEILQKWGLARAAIAKLDGITNTLDDPQIMVNTIALQEAKESSKIENIVTTTDALYVENPVNVTTQFRTNVTMPFRSIVTTPFRFMLTT